MLLDIISNIFHDLVIFFQTLLDLNFVVGDIYELFKK